MAENSLQVVRSNSEIQSNQPQTFAPRTLGEAMEFAKLISESGMVPKDYAGKSRRDRGRSSNGHGSRPPANAGSSVDCRH